jgi:hypothetical protein
MPRKTLAPLQEGSQRELRSRLPNSSVAGAVEVDGSLERLGDALGRSIVVGVTSNLVPFYKSPKVARSFSR